MPLVSVVHPRESKNNLRYSVDSDAFAKISELTRNHGSQFVIFQRGLRDKTDSLNDGVYVFNGKYYRVSSKQFEDNSNFINQGFDVYRVSVKLKNWKYGVADRHLNEHAVDQVMRDFAKLWLKDSKKIARKK